MRFLIFILLISSPSFGQIAGVAAIGGVVGYNYDIQTTQSPTSYNNAGTVVIMNKKFTNMDLGTNNGNCVYVSGTSNITFINCTFDKAIRKAIVVEGLSSGYAVTIKHCLINAVEAGVEASASDGADIRMDNVQIINPWGYPRCKGQLIQFANWTNAPNSYVRNCRGESFKGQGNHEDWISMYASSGTSGSPIKIEFNMFRGGGPSHSGGGIMSGDTDGGYQLVQNNRIWQAGRYGLAIASGVNIKVKNNKVYVPTNDGIADILTYIYGGQNGATTCSGHEMSGNKGHIFNGNVFYGGNGSPTEDCGHIDGISDGYVGNEGAAWGLTNSSGLTAAEIAMPGTLIDFVKEDLFYQMCNKALDATFTGMTGTCKDYDQLPSPTANAGADDAISNTAYTLVGSGSGGTGSLTHKWTQVSGPVKVTMASPTSTSNVVNGLVNGVFEFRWTVWDSNNCFHSDWTTITVSGL